MREKKNQQPPISMEVYRQLIYDVAMDMTGGGRKDHPNTEFAKRLIDLADRPVI
jgi:hypothetical protein